MAWLLGSGSPRQSRNLAAEWKRASADHWLPWPCHHTVILPRGKRSTTHFSFSTKSTLFHFKAHASFTIPKVDPFCACMKFSENILVSRIIRRSQTRIASFAMILDFVFFGKRISYGEIRISRWNCWLDPLSTDRLSLLTHRVHKSHLEASGTTVTRDTRVVSQELWARKPKEGKWGNWKQITST